jgi:hypothetical protein
MDSFKSMLESDMNIFFNPDEFGEIADINGVLVNIVKDNDQLEYRLNKDTSGLLTGDILFYITYSEFEKIPKVKHPPRPGDALLFNGIPETITTCKDESGMYQIILLKAGW